MSRDILIFPYLTVRYNCISDESYCRPSIIGNMTMKIYSNITIWVTYELASCNFCSCAMYFPIVRILLMFSCIVHQYISIHIPVLDFTRCWRHFRCRRCVRRLPPSRPRSSMRKPWSSTTRLTSSVLTTLSSRRPSPRSMTSSTKSRKVGTTNQTTAEQTTLNSVSPEMRLCAVLKATSCRRLA